MPRDRFSQAATSHLVHRTKHLARYYARAESEAGSLLAGPLEKFEFTQGIFMTINNRFAALAALLALSLTGAVAVADEHPFTEGQVVNVAAIRTEYGKFDDYMKFLDTTWKASQEAAKKAGYITGYKVITVESRSENDPDIYLVIYYKNWAALDGATAKGDAIAKQVEGSTAAASQGMVDRGKIRRVLGSWTGQQLDLK
jgi:hypothetical protein